jgi:hypothetical protein
MYNRFNKKQGKKRGQRKNRRQNPGSGYVRSSGPNAPMIRAPNMHKFVRNCSFSQAQGDDIGVYSNSGWTSGASTDMAVSYSLQNTYIYVGGTLLFTLPVPNYNDLVALFLWYKIRSVQIEFLFGTTISQVGNNIQLPTLYTVVDQIDVASTALGTILQNRNLKIGQLGASTGRALTYRHKPKAQLLAYNGASSGYVEDKTDPWISTAYPTVPHYGSKHILTTHPLGSNTFIGTCSINIVYEIEVKDPQ